MKFWNWFKCASVRAAKTMAQTAIAVIGIDVVSTPTVISDINWLYVLSASILAGFISYLMAIKGLPECKNHDDNV